MHRPHDVFAEFHAPTTYGFFSSAYSVSGISTCQPSQGSGHGLPIRVQVLNIRVPCSVSRISNVLRSTARKF